MASKIPPHVARELRRHVSTPLSSPKTSPTTSSSLFSFDPKVLAGCLALTATMAAVPYFFMHAIRPLNERDDALTGSQIRRGAFNNSGSKDVGKDPYWDFKRGRRKKAGEDGCVDDGGYEELFRRDDPAEVDIGDRYRSARR
ncbi:hypothetical protein ACHAW6_002287 [Cyclotella cf. meneghiniana]